MKRCCVMLVTGYLKPSKRHLQISRYLDIVVVEVLSVVVVSQLLVES